MTSRAFDFVGPAAARPSSTSAHASTTRAGDWTPRPGRPARPRRAQLGLPGTRQDLLEADRGRATRCPSSRRHDGTRDRPGAPSRAGNVQIVRAAPHSEVLREAALAITHCGHGVTIKALAAMRLRRLPADGTRPTRRRRARSARRRGVRLEPAAAPEKIASAAHCVLADGSYRDAAERIAAMIVEETVSDMAVDEIEAVLAAAREEVVA